MDKTPLWCGIYTSPALSMFVDLELGLRLCLTLLLDWNGLDFVGKKL